MKSMKTAKSSKELMELAKEAGEKTTLEQAEGCNGRLHLAAKELSDEEVDCAAGGRYRTANDHKLTTMENECEFFICKSCWTQNGQGHTVRCPYEGLYTCLACRYCSYENGLWICGHN